MNQPKQIAGFSAFIGSVALVSLIVDPKDPFSLAYMFALCFTFYALIVFNFKIGHAPTSVEPTKGNPPTRIKKILFAPERMLRVLNYHWAKRQNRK